LRRSEIDTPEYRQPVLELIQTILVLGQVAREMRDPDISIVVSTVGAVSSIRGRLEHLVAPTDEQCAATKGASSTLFAPPADKKGIEIGEVRR
jgi:hypothetical protein